MIRQSFMVVGNLAGKVQFVSTKVALSAAKVAEKMATKVATIQARAAARAQARALNALAKRPSIRFMREMRHGQTSISFYQSIDHRSGKVGNFWTLNRDTSRGRVRLAMGTMSEFRDLRSIVRRSLRQDVRTGQEAARSLEPPRQAKVALERPTNARESQRRPELPRHEPARAPRPQRPREVTQSQAKPVMTPWFTLLYIETLNRDGTGRGRVVRNYTDLEKAQANQGKLPGLVIYRRTGPRPLQRGDIVNLKPSYSPEVAHRIAELRKGQKLNGPAQATGVEGDVGLNNRQKRRLSLGQ